MNRSEISLYVSDLLNFLDESPCNIYAVNSVVKRLESNGFKKLDPRLSWKLERGGKYFLVKNDSALFAFVVGMDPEAGWKIISSHSDSPGFRVKPSPEIRVENRVLKLNTEVYGGPILYTWFDRPLSLAGRVFLRGGDSLLNPKSIKVDFKRPLLTIPHLAIHYNRQVNEGNKLSRQKDMLPVLALINDRMESDNFLLKIIATELSVEVEDIADYDLTLYDTSKACLVGAHDEFISSGRIDDLMMVHASTMALIERCDQKDDTTRVIAIFDNEETGSGTKQGAASPVLHNILQRINLSLGCNEECFFKAIDRSFMISADNAHALHPNYVEKQDPTNHPFPGGGPVIKINANCKYMTDADTAAVFESICRRAGVPVQRFVNHSDSAGGSTLGNILTSQIDLRGVDMGAAQWAMHSCRETAAVADVDYTIKAFSQFFSPDTF